MKLTAEVEVWEQRADDGYVMAHQIKGRVSIVHFQGRRKGFPPLPDSE